MRYSINQPSLDDDELHPGDYCCLIEGDPYLVGNRPEIAEAFRHGWLARVLKKEWRILTEREAKALGSTAEYEITVKFVNVKGAFVFWLPFLRKVQDEKLGKKRA